MNTIAHLPQIRKCLIITFLVVISYWPTFSGDFLFDDNALVKNNQFIRNPQSIIKYFSQEDGIADERDFGSYHSGYYRPLINMAYRLHYISGVWCILILLTWGYGMMMTLK